MGGTTSKPELGNLAPQAYETLTKSMEVFNELNQEYLSCVRWNCNDLFKRYQDSYEEFRSITFEAKKNNLGKEMEKYLSFLHTANQKWLPDALTYLKCDANHCTDKEQKFLDAVQILMEQFKQLQEKWDNCSFRESREQMKESERNELEFIYKSVYPVFAKIYQNLLNTRTSFMADIKTTGTFTGNMNGLVRIPEENRIALVSEGVITDGALERVITTKKGKGKGKTTFSKGSRPKLEAVLQSRMRCNIDKQWDWGNSPMENFLYKYRGIVRENIRGKTSILISKIQWDGAKGSLSVQGFMSLIPQDYIKWCNRRRGKNKMECLKRPEVATMTDTLKKWVEFTFDKEENDVSRWWISQTSFLNKLVSNISTSVIVSSPELEDKKVEENDKTEDKVEQQVLPQQGTISIGGGKKGKNVRKGSRK
jgi:hypothetical protein